MRADSPSSASAPVRGSNRRTRPERPARLRGDGGGPPAAAARAGAGNRCLGRCRGGAPRRCRVGRLRKATSRARPSSAAGKSSSASRGNRRAPGAWPRREKKSGCCSVLGRISAISSSRGSRPGATSANSCPCSGRMSASRLGRRARRGNTSCSSPETKTADTAVVPVGTRLAAVLDLRRHAPDGTRLEPDAYVFGDLIGEPVKSIKKDAHSLLRFKSGTIESCPGLRARPA